MSESPADDVRFARPRHVPGVELVSVAYRERSFPEHSHEEIVIGAITAGAEALEVRGTPHRADAGSVLRLHPGEPHANRSIGPGVLRYSVLYVPADTLAAFASDGGTASLRFAEPVTRSPALFDTICEVHAALAAADAGKLEQESAMTALAAAIEAEPAGTPPIAPAPHPEIEEARRFLDAHLAESIGLSDLSALTGLSPFHLVRTFKRSVGLSPLAYRNQRRIAAARDRLAQGEAIVQVALDLGFADQSHFTRQFQRIVGVSPQRYARGVRSG